MNKLCIALLCCFLMLCFPCMAATSIPCFDVSATDDSVKVNDSVYLLVDLKDNPGFGAMQFCITYDKGKLLLENVTSGELIPAGSITSVNTDIAGEINFSVISVADITGSGTVVIAEFRAISAGDARFDFKLLAYADSDGESLDAASNDAEIAVESDTASDEQQNTEDDTEDDDTSENVTTNKKPGGSSHNSSAGLTDTNNEPDTSENAEPTPPKEGMEISFSDVTEAHWAYNQIYKVAQMGLFGGTGEDTFSPDLPMTRAMFVTVLHRYAGSPESEKADFADIEDSWYTDAVSWAAKNNIVSGTGDNKFSPNSYITRGEISTILCRYKSGKSIYENSVNNFKDGSSIPEWGRESVAWAVEQGLIMGREGGLIAFYDNATRVETAVIFTRFLNVK